METGWKFMYLCICRAIRERDVDAAVRAGVTDEVSAQALMRDQPSVIKRPVVEWGDRITVGFDAKAWSARAA